MVADKSLLVEHRPVAAEEAVLGRRGHQPVVVLDRQADVEDLNKIGKQVNDRILVKMFAKFESSLIAHLAAACNIGIVSVVLAFAGEGIGIVGTGCGQARFSFQGAGLRIKGGGSRI